jgi:hypothetical protein
MYLHILWASLEYFYICYVNKDYKSLLPCYKLTPQLNLCVFIYLLQLLNLSWAQTKPVGYSSVILLLLFCSLV